MALEVVKMFAVLIGVLGLILLLAYAMRKLGLGGRGSDSGSEGWRVLGVKMLGPKRQIYVLEVGTRILLIGVTDRTMNALMQVDDAKDREMITAALSRKRRPLSSFQDILKRAEG